MSSYYFEFLVSSSSSDLLEIFADQLDQPFEYRDGNYIFALDSQDSEFENQVVKICKEAGVEYKTSWQKKESQNWVDEYKKSINPVVCADFYVRPSWCEKSSDKIDLIIDPELVFGTGHHSTTCGALEALSSIELAGKTLLDVGSGSGILAIAATLKGAKASLCDTDELAVIDSLKNAQINGTIIENYWVGSAKEASGKYEIVVANIVTDVLVAIRSDLVNLLKSDSILILSGILDRYEDKIKQSFASLALQQTIKKGEWITLIYKSRGEI